MILRHWLAKEKRLLDVLDPSMGPAAATREVIRVFEHEEAVDELVQSLDTFIRNRITQLEAVVDAKDARFTQLTAITEAAQNRCAEQFKLIGALEKQLRIADGAALGALSRAGIFTPAEGFRKAGWGWLEHHIGELEKQRNQAMARIAELEKAAASPVAPNDPRLP